MMCLGRLLVSLGLLHAVVAWVGDIAAAGQTGMNQSDWPIRMRSPTISHNHGRHLRKNRLNNSYANSVDPDLRDPINDLDAPLPHMPEVLRRIRCCNAYASYFSLQVSHKDQAIMNGIAYGHCEERDVSIRVGDPLQLHVNNQNRVAFLESNMIEPDSLLLLVAYKGLNTDALKFKSHVYKSQSSDDQSASVVTMNIFDGSKVYQGWNMLICDDESQKTNRCESLSKLQRDTVVPIHPGKYIIYLRRDGEKKKIAEQKFIAKPNRLYSVLRIGSGEYTYVDDDGVSDFPSEIVVFPQSKLDDTPKRSAARESFSTLALTIASVLCIIP